MHLLSRRSAALSVICGAALSSAPARAAVEASEQARIEAEAVKAYIAKSDAEKLAASDKLVAAHANELNHDAGSGFLGNANGDVTIVQFFDYDCGFSKRVEPR